MRIEISEINIFEYEIGSVILDSICRTACTIGLVLIAAIALLICAMLMILIKKGIHNLNRCDDELFQNIDRFTHSLKKFNSNDYYVRLIQMINLYYKSEGKIDELVKNKEMEQLFKRKDFLLKRKSYFNDFYTYLSSFGISFIASLTFNVIDEKYSGNGVISFIYVFFICLVLLAIFGGKYRKRGYDGSYDYLVAEYELKCLERKIDTLEDILAIKDDDEKLLCGQQVIIDQLIDIWEKAKGKKSKKEIEDSIERVRSLELCLEDYAGTYIKEMNIKGQKVYLIYDEEKGRENNYAGKLNLKTPDYIILYEIIEKYQLDMRETT